MITFSVAHKIQSRHIGIALIVGSLASLLTVVWPAISATPSYHSLATEFVAFVDETKTLPQAQRVAAFKERFNRQFPGFYEPVHETSEHFDELIAASLTDFPKVRQQYEQTLHDFPAAYNDAIAHFRKHFPGFEPALPVWFVHSLGRMDGGTRTFGGKTYMIFGADMIARIHNDGTIGAFLDHELFHVENGQWFKDCDPDTTIWCSLWQEGSAVYAASIMNTGATDHMLMLDLPRPIRADVDAQWSEAVCQSLKDLDKSDDATYSSYFSMSGQSQAFPRRWGYYLGYRMMQRIGKRYSLAQMDHFDHATVCRMMMRELHAMAPRACAQTAKIVIGNT